MATFPTTGHSESNKLADYVDLVCYGPGGKSIHFVKIDLVDLPRVLALSSNWRVANFYHSKKHGQERLYAYSCVNRRIVYLHRFVTNCPPELEADHLNDSLDNRRASLRVGTHAENMRNKRKYQWKTRVVGIRSPRRRK